MHHIHVYHPPWLDAIAETPVRLFLLYHRENKTMILALPLFALSYDTLLGCTTQEPATYVILCSYDMSAVPGQLLQYYDNDV